MGYTRRFREPRTPGKLNLLLPRGQLGWNKPTDPARHCAFLPAHFCPKGYHRAYKPALDLTSIGRGGVQTDVSGLGVTGKQTLKARGVYALPRG